MQNASIYLYRIFCLAIAACRTILLENPRRAHTSATPTKHSQFLIQIVMNLLTKVFRIVSLDLTSGQQRFVYVVGFLD